MHLLTLNAAGKSLAPPRTLDPSRRRLSQVIGRHVDRSRPHMIAVQRARDPLQPIDEAWVTRGRDKAGKVKPWPRRYLPADAVVVVVYLPRGGLGGSSGSRGGGGKSALSIAAGIAGLALVAFAGPLAAALLPSLIFGSVAPFLLQAGLVIGGTALLSLASKSKANKQATDTTQIYGVAGGGNLPKPGDRIPRGYGRTWMKPDLSQPDFSQYDGDDQILLKRHTLGVGKYHPYKVRAGKQVMWQEGSGFVAPFDDSRNRIEFIYGTASTLVPSNVVAASGVGGTLPRPADNPALAGPFLINQRGALITRIQIDFQFPGGISSSATKKSGAQISNLPGFWSVLFEYAPIDESGAITGAWAPAYDASNDTEGTRFSTHPLRYTKFKDVPPGRYAVRGRNRRPDTTGNQGVEGTAVNIDAVQWDAASGWVGDVAVRPGVTEMALRIYATKGNQAAAFGEIEIDAGAIIPVWTGSAWVEQETSKAVWAYLDVMRNADYGGAISDDQLDLGTALYYAGALSEFDTFDASIRGPVSVYEAAATALLPMRAEPVHLGRFWSLVRDEPKSVRRHMITRGQMLKGSSQITFDLDTESGAGHVIGEFDQDGDYRNPNQSTAIYGAASLTPTRQRWTGVKSFAHATHLTRWRAASGAYRRQATPFGVEMEGRIYKRGDSISVDPWFIDVRKKANVVDNRGDTLVLDADVPVTGTDAISLRDRDGREWGPLAIAGQGASPREITLSTSSRQQVESATGRALSAVLSDGRRDMTTVLVGALVDLKENYLIQSVKPDGVSRAQVEALIDDPRVWAAIGAAVGNPPSGYAGVIEPESPAILSLTAVAVPVAAGFRLDYTIRPGRGARSFEVGLSYDTGNRFDTRTDAGLTGSIDLNPVDPITLVLRARAFGPSGLPGVYAYASVGLPAATVNAILQPIAYEDLATTVRDRFEALQQQAEAAEQEAQNALATATARLDDLRRALALDPAIRQGYVDTIIGDLRGDLGLLLTSADRNATALAELQGALTTAGLEIIPGEGRARFYAIEALQTEVGTQVTNLSVTVDALSKQIELYGSVQAGDLQGLITQISTVTVTLNALQGTIASLATSAQFDAASARLSSAEQRLDAQAATIVTKAERVTVDAQGIQLTQVRQSLDAALGVIAQSVQAIGSTQLDQALLPKTLDGLMGLLGEQIGGLQQNFARAESSISANIDETGRSVAEVSTRLLVLRGEASAQFETVTRAVADTNYALVQATTIYNAQFAEVTASLVQEIQVRAAADSATTSNLSGVLSRIGTAEAGLTSLGQTVATNQSSAASQFSGVTARFGTLEGRTSAAEAAVTSLTQSQASDRAANASTFQGVSASLTGLADRAFSLEGRASVSEATIAQIAYAYVTADQALASRSDLISARAENANAGVSTVSQALASTNQTLANVNFDLVSRSNAGTAFGRFGMNTVSAPSGVSVRIAAVASTESFGQQRNAGWYLDLMPNGTSRFVIDANFFALTANGGITYPFQFDGQTLTVPSLRVTQSVILPGAVSDRFAPLVQNIDAGGSSGSWREVPGTGVSFTADDLWSSIFSATVQGFVQAVGSNSTTFSATISFAVGIDGVPLTTFATVSGQAGGGFVPNVTNTQGPVVSSPAYFEMTAANQNRRIAILYKFEAGPGSTGRINVAQIKLQTTKR
ncbi:host specificity factor TipJ family phage tail protein [Methylobacterium sp. WL9]|uniref:host specificity factor TipJ family phage tail protein n=1 Tax=Methylobacterium sp. WL9 TaxID=2603898 RepID=UPI0011CB16D6|nr:host specificity factor TipJ family phage tail protein [Methylobacterium sp. WL9]TXN23983.1 hypothetical protein FV217_04770 [Methylobacterium sp. WL9]